MVLHGRLLDRRRMAGDDELTRAALAAYRNRDGGFAYLEPDLPDPGSQPIAALDALEVLHEVGAGDADPLVAGIGEWLAGVGDEDGAVPFVLPFDPEAVPHAPWMAPQDDPPPSLHMTAAVVGAAHRAGMSGGRAGEWLERASAFVWDGLPGSGSGYEAKYLIDFLDAVPDRDAAERALDELAPAIGGRSSLLLADGTETGPLTALMIAPRPDHAGRRLFDPAAIEHQLDELEAAQADDGGWTFDWLAWNDAASWAWRGRLTVDALRILRLNGRLG